MGPALEYIGGQAEPLVVKASGLAAGKGAVVCRTREDAVKVVRAMLDGALGEAGKEVLIEEFLAGEELSVLALTDSERVLILPPAQDHKRLGEGDTGPNTGGMGAYCPVSITTDALLARVRAEIFEPVLREVAAQGTPYEGVIYAGLKILPDGTPSVLEFNARFGDPETQVYLTRLENDLVELLDASVGGTLSKFDLKWSPQPSVCVVMASGGYPGSYAKGKVITGLDAANALPGAKVFHAGTARAGDQVVTSGGRVLGVTALGKDLCSAQAAAYAAVEKIQFEGAQFRRDIAAKALR
jgi:phosphoribosylamine--glycine ligase